MKKIHIRPSGNSTCDVVNALHACSDGAELIFENADYHFYGDGAHCEYFAPTNNANGIKRIVFPIIGKHNVAIRGNGARFIFHSRLFPFIVSGSCDIVLEGFSIDFSFPRYALGEVAAVDDTGITLHVDKEKFPYQVKNGCLGFLAGDEVRSTADKKFFLSGLPGDKCPVIYLVAGDTADPLTNLPVGVLRTDALELAHGVIRLDYRPGSEKIAYHAGQKLLISNDENRENDVFFLEKSRGVKLKDISIHRGAGMGVIAQLCTDISVDGMRIAVPEWRAEPVSITADAFHFVHCDGKAIIRNCSVSDTLDDAINIHGIYTRVDNVVGPKEAYVSLGHHEQYGFCPYMPGDTLVSVGEHGEKGRARLEACELTADGTGIKLTFDEDITGIISAGDHIEVPGRMPEILIENNNFCNCPRVLLSSSKHTVVRGNEFKLAGAVTLMDSMKYWYEAGPVTDVTIENNTFHTESAAITAVVYGAEATGRRHSGICVSDNRVIGGGILMDASYADNMTISGPGEVRLHVCKNVIVNGEER